MQKHELIQAMEGLADETDIIVQVAFSSEVRQTLSAHYVRMRADEPACLSIVVSPQSDAATEQGQLRSAIRRIEELESVVADIASGELGINLCIKYAKKASSGEVAK